MRNLAYGGALIAAAAFALAGCSSGATSTETAAISQAAAGGAAAGATANGTYVFLPKSLNNPYWVDARKGMEDQAAKLGVTAQFLGPDSDDAGQQVAIFEQILATHPAGIAVSPNDPASVKNIIDQAKAAGIPVIAWDGPVPDSAVQGYIGTDNVAAGAQEAEALASAMGGTGKVAVIIGSLSATNLNQRYEGLKQGFAKHPDIEVVATEESGESIADAQSKAETVLQAHPDIAGMAGISGSDLPGIVGALTAAGKCGTVKSVGFDVVPQGVQGMQAGCVDALMSQRPYGMTADALDILVDLNKGTSQLSENFNVDTGVEVVTPSTLETFMSSAPH